MSGVDSGFSTEAEEVDPMNSSMAEKVLLHGANERTMSCFMRRKISRIVMFTLKSLVEGAKVNGGRRRRTVTAPPILDITWI